MSMPPQTPPASLDYARTRAGFETVCHVEGGLIISPPLIDLPHRCIYCNEPGTKRLTMKYQWHHPGLYFIILVNLIIYAIVAMVVQKKGQAQLSLCALHAAKRFRKRMIFWLLTLATLSLIIIGPVLENMRVLPRDGGIPFLIFGILGGIIMLAFAALSGRVLKAKFIDQRMMKLGGAGAPFLQSLGGPPQVPVAQPVY